MLQIVHLLRHCPPRCAVVNSLYSANVALNSGVLRVSRKSQYINLASNLSSSPTDVRNNATVIGSVTRPLAEDSGRYKLVTVPNALCVGRWWPLRYEEWMTCGMVYGELDEGQAATVEIVKTFSVMTIKTSSFFCPLGIICQEGLGDIRSGITEFLKAHRIIATPIVGYLVMQHDFPLAFGVFVAAGATDMLDGFIARNVPGQRSLLGSVLDPIADKLLVSVMFVTMSCAALIPWQLTAVVLTRDLSLIVGGFYKRYKSMEPPYSLRRFFSPEVSSMQIVPSTVSKVNTVLQLSVIATCLSIPVFGLGDLCTSVSTGLCWVTAFTTVWSGLQYATGQAFKKV